ncbi:hypothetical protein RIVM261_011970 [Rivularia sp. IAM M-261]|nr:hypothetical protein RIVM261_011970 [Rivularia sp. IAM M-261]
MENGLRCHYAIGKEYKFLAKDKTEDLKLSYQYTLALNLVAKIETFLVGYPDTNPQLKSGCRLKLK